MEAPKPQHPSQLPSHQVCLFVLACRFVVRFFFAALLWVTYVLLFHYCVCSPVAAGVNARATVTPTPTASLSSRVVVCARPVESCSDSLRTLRLGFTPAWGTSGCRLRFYLVVYMMAAPSMLCTCPSTCG